MTSRTYAASVIVIGNEILSGRTQDTNLKHIAETVGGWGIQTHEARVIPDVETVIVNAIRKASQEFDYVFTTGGIGPTHDDITAACIAKAFELELIEHPEIAAVIQGRPAPADVMASRLRMARVPDGAALIDNPTGGPQGFSIENVYVMAGIPVVMQAMLSTLKGKLVGGTPVQSRSVTAYLGESQIAAALGEVQERYPNVDLGSYPFARDGRYGTTLVIRGTEESALDAMLSEVKSIIEAAGEVPSDLRTV